MGADSEISSFWIRTNLLLNTNNFSVCKFCPLLPYMYVCTQKQGSIVLSNFPTFNTMTSCALYVILFVFQEDLAFARKWNWYWCHTYWMISSIVSLYTFPCASCNTFLVLLALSPRAHSFTVQNSRNSLSEKLFNKKKSNNQSTHCVA